MTEVEIQDKGNRRRAKQVEEKHDKETEERECDYRGQLEQKDQAAKNWNEEVE